MGYDFHITCKEYWADDEGPRISLDEWIAYAGSDIDVKPDSDNPGAGNWIVENHDGACPLWWDDSGEVVAKNPDQSMVKKLVAIANALGARVLGDDGEIYGV